MFDHKPSAVASAVPSGFLSVPEPGALRTAHTTAKTSLSRAPARRSPWPTVAIMRRRLGEGGFTLVELVVTMGVLVLLVLLFTQLLNSAATITILGHKQMDADSQARQLLDRMAVDFAQMVKRTDIDYYLKSSSGNSTGTPPDCTTCTKQTTDDLNHNDPTGNDQIAFFASTSGYFPPAPTPGSQSPISLIAYRVNSNANGPSYNKMERMGKGFFWNGISSSYKPILFLDTAPTTTIANKWPAAVSSSMPDPDGNYEIVGPQIFRFEYYYLLKGQVVNGTTYNPVFSATPWDTNPNLVPLHTNVSGMRDVTAIIVDIAVIDPKSKVLLSDTTTPPQIAQVAAQLIDWGDASCGGCPSPTQWQTTPGLLRAQWQNALDGITNLPRPAISGIRLYERYFYLNQ
jgi:type II secretory pathway pseudopilin PulG